MSATLDAPGPGALLDYSTPLFHEADFPPGLSPRIFQGTFQGGQDVRRALWGTGFTILSYFFATAGGLHAPLPLTIGSSRSRFGPWDVISRHPGLGLGESDLT